MLSKSFNALTCVRWGSLEGRINKMNLHYKRGLLTHVMGLCDQWWLLRAEENPITAQFVKLGALAAPFWC